MAETPSNMIPLGFTAADFNLPDVVSDEKRSLNDLKSETATVIMFICNHCPFVIHIMNGLLELTKEYTSKGIAIIGISSNDVVNYPQDSPERMKELALQKGFVFPYLFDETQEVAKAYDAACTPDFFVFDSAMKCVYRGQFDDSRPGNKMPVTGNDMRATLDALLNGGKVSMYQKPSIGCNIKWK